MRKVETIIGVLALLVSIGLVVLGLRYREYLVGIANLEGYSLLGIFILSLVASSVVSLTFIPVPYYLPVFVLSSTLSMEWGPLSPLFVGSISATGASLGQLPTFVIGYTGKPVSERLASRINERLYQRAFEWVKKHGALAVFAVSAILNPLHLPLTLALGTLKYPPVKWLILTLSGNMFKNLAIAFAGYFTLNSFM